MAERVPPLDIATPPHIARLLERFRQDRTTKAECLELLHWLTALAVDTASNAGWVVGMITWAVEAKLTRLREQEARRAC